MGRLFTLWGYIRRYKYMVALVIFLLILGVLDENSLWVRYQRQVEIGNLHQEIDKYQAQFDAETAQLQALETDPVAVERLAREKYLMKRDNEDVFVFMDANEYQIRTTAQKADSLPVTKPDSTGLRPQV
ncbi:MAG: septum formation initiator family protein [Bacteroidaceae bacterium]|nr:septum formation initiator family protein [Bacteroidaceae bacterium]